MLVLGRKQGQTILVGPDIKIIITGASGMVRVGIEAPADMKILRGEVIPDDTKPTSKPKEKSSERASHPCRTVR